MFLYNVCLFAYTPSATEYIIERVCEEVGDLPDCSSTTTSSRAAEWSTLFSLMSAGLAIVTTCFLGVLSDTYGRKPVAIFSSGCMGLALLSGGVIAATKAPIWTLIITNLFVGLSGSFYCFISALFAFVADISTPDKRANNFGIIVAILYVGGLIAPIIGGQLTETFGYSITFFILGGGMICVCFETICCVPESLALHKRATKIDWWHATIIGSFDLCKTPR